MELPKTMELPKNIVQIGKPDPTHKIFVEDYVISYMKQWNKHGKRDTGIVLFGKRMVEEEYRYYFVYGAAYMPGVEARMQYLTEEEREDAEKVRAKHFAEYELLGWGELRGELPDGFYMCEHGKGVWIRGYACFFEKNESMLSFMVTDGLNNLEHQTAVMHKETTQSSLAREDNIDARMEERNRKLEQIRQNNASVAEKGNREIQVKEGQVKTWKNGAMVMALIVCVVAGLVLTDEDKRKGLETMVGKAVATVTKSADKLQENEVETLQAGTDILAPESSFDTEAGENQSLKDVETSDETQKQGDATGQDGEQLQGDVTGQGGEQPQGDMTGREGEQPQGETSEQDDAPEGQENQSLENPTEPSNVASGEGESSEEGQEVVARYVSYTIQKGDTLLDICRRECGSESLLKQVCQLNNIENPDDIKIGQIILLPE